MLQPHETWHFPRIDLTEQTLETRVSWGADSGKNLSRELPQVPQIPRHRIRRWRLHGQVAGKKLVATTVSSREVRLKRREERGRLWAVKIAWKHIKTMEWQKDRARWWQTEAQTRRRRLSVVHEKGKTKTKLRKREKMKTQEENEEADRNFNMLTMTFHWECEAKVTTTRAAAARKKSKTAAAQKKGTKAANGSKGLCGSSFATRENSESAKTEENTFPSLRHKRRQYYWTRRGDQQSQKFSRYFRGTSSWEQENMRTNTGLEFYWP